MFVCPRVCLSSTLQRGWGILSFTTFVSLFRPEPSASRGGETSNSSRWWNICLFTMRVKHQVTRSLYQVKHLSTQYNTSSCSTLVLAIILLTSISLNHEAAYWRYHFSFFHIKRRKSIQIAQQKMTICNTQKGT